MGEKHGHYQRIRTWTNTRHILENAHNWHHNIGFLLRWSLWFHVEQHVTHLGNLLFVKGSTWQDEQTTWSNHQPCCLEPGIDILTFNIFLSATISGFLNTDWFYCSVQIQQLAFHSAGNHPTSTTAGLRVSSGFLFTMLLIAKPLTNQHQE